MYTSRLHSTYQSICTCHRCTNAFPLPQGCHKTVRVDLDTVGLVWVLMHAIKCDRNGCTGSCPPSVVEQCNQAGGKPATCWRCAGISSRNPTVRIPTTCRAPVRPTSRNSLPTCTISFLCWDKNSFRGVSSGLGLAREQAGAIGSSAEVSAPLSCPLSSLTNFLQVIWWVFWKDTRHAELTTHHRFKQRLSLWCQQQLQQSQLCLLMLHNVLLKHTFGTSPLPWTQGPVTWELRRGLSPVRSGSVSNWQESA